MQPHLRNVLVGASLALTLWCLVASGFAGGNKDAGWKEFLSDKDAQELTNRALQDARDALADKPDADAIKRAQFQLLTMAAFARSVQGGDVAKRGEVYQNALHVANLLAQKGKVAEARALLEPNSPGVNKRGFDGDLQKTGVVVAELMEHYKPQGKGGEGIHPSLQSTLKLKGKQGGIEEKIRALAMKKLTAAGLAKESEELALMSYRIAAVGEVVYQFAPAKKIGKKDPDDWRDYSLAMRDAGIELAVAARKKDAEGVLKASDRLNSSCSQCHGTFRLGK